MVEVTGVTTVTPEDIGELDAQRAGFASVKGLATDLQGEPDAQIYRIEMHLSADADARARLAADAALGNDELDNLRKRLAPLDRQRVWTRDTLEAIAAQPGRRAGDLAPQLGWSELQDFKLHVRQLKALGLTTSLRVGYRLSPRGEAYLQATQAKR